ncbi:hypothetical protein SO694_00002853 [Aureococcus anophagefferens]|uniref:DUF2064 domain-containing protein n=1 Tax=Aureococcus anophagefferens TaxID=44056 RepID=A0ABR1GCR1_AURAN
MAGLACACMPLPLESTDAVVVFLKVPTLHKTKTRLIPRFGAEGAYAIAQALAEDTLRRLGSSPLLDDARRVACFAPADGADRLERLAARAAVAGRFELARWRARDLASSDLGAALRAEYERVRATTPGAVVIVGMDAPDLPLDVVARAATAALRGAPSSTTRRTAATCSWRCRPARRATSSTASSGARTARRPRSARRSRRAACRSRRAPGPRGPTSTSRATSTPSSRASTRSPARASPRRERI